MSIIKQALWPGERQGELLVQEVRPGEQTKTASSLGPGLQAYLDTLRPDPKYTYVLVNAMGYSEFFGANSNKDWYGYNPGLDFNGLLHSWEGIGQDIETDRMKGKNWPYGYPCFYGSTVYAHHKNTDPQRLGFGDVIYAGANPQMKRIELVKRVFNEEAQRKGHTSILSRIRAGERVDVSMGTKVPFDLCSICSDWVALRKAWKTFDAKKHRHPGVAILAYHRTVKPIKGLAVTRKDYCQCMRTQGGKILPDGRKVFVYNDFPRFFDISFVWIGADRTARVMWHMTDGPAPLPSRGTTAGPGSFELLLRRLLNRDKTASMEKEIPDGIAEAVHSDADRMPEMNCSTLSRLGGQPVQSLSTLAAMGIILTPHEFQRMLLGENHPITDQLHKLSFDTEASVVDDAYAVGAEHFDQKLASDLAPLMPSRSAYAPFMGDRMMSPAKVASAKKTRPVLKTAIMEKLSAQYTGYRLSVLDEAEALYKEAAGFLSDAVPQMGKEGDPLGRIPGGPDKRVGDGLLLGRGPMIHLLSAHLRRQRTAGQQLETMPSYFSNNNTFKIMTSIGAALRSAIMINKAGGIVEAAKAVATIARKALT